MAQENGRLNASGLKELSVGGRLTPGAADAFEQLRTAGSRAGVNVTITSAADAYRLYEIQERIFTERYQTAYTQYAAGKVDRRVWQGREWFRRAGTAAAAVPGTSNHGWALAVDIANVGGFNSTFYRWLTATAPQFGFSNTEGASVGEAWHWVYSPTLHASHGGGSGAPGTTTPPTSEEDDDMPSAAEVANAVLNTPDPALGGKTVHQVLAGLIPVRADVATVHSSVLSTRDLLTPGQEGVKFDGDIIKRLADIKDTAAKTRADVATVHASVLKVAPAVAEAVLRTKIPRGGTGTGDTTLASLLAWHDDGTTRILDAITKSVAAVLSGKAAK